MTGLGGKLSVGRHYALCTLHFAFSPPGPCHFNKEQTPLDILRYQPAVSRRLFRCLGAHLLRSPWIVKLFSLVLAMSSIARGHTTSVMIQSSSLLISVCHQKTSSRCRVSFAHRSFTFRCRFRVIPGKIKNPAYFVVSRVGKFYGSSLTCLPPVYPDSFRGRALDTMWIGQG